MSVITVLNIILAEILYKILLCFTSNLWHKDATEHISIHALMHLLLAYKYFYFQIIVITRIFCAVSRMLNL